MILEGNERGYGANLARHLLNPRENDHVTVHRIDGFVAEDLNGAFAEAEAISTATACKNYLFSLSLNPPKDAAVDMGVFEEAVAAAERKLGLTGQPKAIVFHEKDGRRHAHCVWSRIDAETMTAIELPHYKRKLGDVSRDLYRAHGWEMPEGFRDHAKRDPLNTRRAEAQQAKRTGQDRKALKAMFRQCWERSDSAAAFAQALEDQGFALAQGDRRGVVAVDAAGKVWSLSRWCGVKPKELRARLGPEANLPTLEEAQARATKLPHREPSTKSHTAAAQREALVAKQRRERDALLKAQEDRRAAALKARQARMTRGIRAAFLRVTGRQDAYLKRAEAEAQDAAARDRAAQDRLIQQHLLERRALDREMLSRGLAGAVRSKLSRDPRQSLAPAADDLPHSKEALLRQPGLIIDHLSQTKASFERTDVLRALARRIDEPFALKDAADRALAASQTVKLDDKDAPRYTTRDFQGAERDLATQAQAMSSAGGFGVASTQMKAAMKAQDAKMQRAFGARLSREQRAAISHVLSDRQLTSVVGLAGAGKSTMLATAAEAWRRQGLTVHGAALAGKAADGLESASGIKSRTLASLEASWENGHAPIKRGDVLVIDEVGMIGTRQMARVTAKMQDIGAKLVLVGDPDQLQPIEAGRPFRDLTERHGAAKLTEIYRQKEGWQKRASRDLANGNLESAVGAYGKRGSVTRDRTSAEAIESLVEAYAMDVAASGKSTTRLAFAHKRKDVHALNQAIRAALRNPDNVKTEVLLHTETGPRAFSTGDRLVFGRNDKELGLKNGMLGTVASVSPTSLKVAVDGDTPRQVTLNPRTYRHIDHGYAVTIHKSQGATVDRAYVLASRSMDRHLAYVAMTRHRDDMRLYINGKDQPI